MGSEETKNTFESSINALKTVYYVIIGLAITEALKRTFTQGGLFVGKEVFGLNRILLVLAFILTICRFVHGASIHLGKFSEKSHKPLLDFAGFIFQGILFYIMALALSKQPWFLITFIIMLFFDTVWLLILKIGKIIVFTSTEKQWLRSDIIMMLLFVVLLFVANFIDKTLSSLFSMLYVFMTALLATYFDYKRNWNFYFPKS